MITEVASTSTVDGRPVTTRVVEVSTVKVLVTLEAWLCEPAIVLVVVSGWRVVVFGLLIVT